MSGPFGASFEALDRPRIPGYTIDSVLGQGGHAAVFAARAEDDGAPVALKLWLDPALAEAGARIAREAAALERLDHPAIARLRALTRDDRGRPCIVMDRIAGEPFSEVLTREGPQSPARTIAIGRALAGALEALRAAGLVHRDIKPSNVIIEAGSGRPVLIDFSIVKPPAPAAEAPVTETGVGLGTAPYMPPEQCEGAAPEGALDHRADIYGLGALLFHALTGAPPWRRETAWERRRRDPWADPHPGDPALAARIREAQAAVPPALARVVARCLSGEPAARFATGAELDAALAGAGAGPRRRGLAGALMLILTAAAIFFVFFDQGAGLAPNQGEPTRKDPPMSKITRAAPLVPLLVIAAASALEAQVYEDVKQPLPPPGRGFIVKKAVRDLDDYFPAGRRVYSDGKSERVLESDVPARPEDGKPMFAGGVWKTEKPPRLLPEGPTALSCEGFAELDIAGFKETCLVIAADFTRAGRAGRAILYYARHLGLARCELSEAGGAPRVFQIQNADEVLRYKARRVVKAWREALAEDRFDEALKLCGSSFFFVESNLLGKDGGGRLIGRSSDFDQREKRALIRRFFEKELASWARLEFEFTRPRPSRVQLLMGSRDDEARAIVIPADAVTVLAPVVKEKDAAFEIYLGPDGRIIGLVKLDAADDGTFADILWVWKSFQPIKDPAYGRAQAWLARIIEGSPEARALVRGDFFTALRRLDNSRRGLWEFQARAGHELTAVLLAIQLLCKRMTIAGFDRLSGQELDELDGRAGVLKERLPEGGYRLNLIRRLNRDICEVYFDKEGRVVGYIIAKN